MNRGLLLPAPRIVPALDPAFRPAVLANRAFQAGVQSGGIPIQVALERGDGSVSRFEMTVAAPDTKLAEGNFTYVERLLKFFLWSRGGCKIHFAGPSDVGRDLQKHYRDSA